MKLVYYQNLRTRSAKLVDRVFAEPIFLMPEQSSDVADGLEFEGVLRTDERDAKGVLSGRGQGWNTHIAGTAAILYIDAVTNPMVRPVAKDRIRAISREGQPWFEVAFVDPRNHARLVIHLKEA